MSEKTSWEDINNGKPLPPIDTQGSNKTGVKTEQRSGVKYLQFSTKKPDKTINKRSV